MSFSCLPFSQSVGTVLTFGIIPLMSFLNSRVARLGSPGLNGGDVIRNKAKFMSLFASVYFFVVHFLTFCMPQCTHSSGGGGMMIILLVLYLICDRFFFCVSETEFVLALDIIFLDNLYSANTDLQITQICTPLIGCMFIFLWGIYWSNLWSSKMLFLSLGYVWLYHFP